MDIFKKTFRNIFLLGLLTVWIPGLFYLNPSAVATDLTIDPDNLEDFTVNALVMEVYPNESLMVVGEKRIFIIKPIARSTPKTNLLDQNDREVKLDDLKPIAGSTSKTNLLDQNDREVKLDDFKIGERLLVKGFKLPDGAIKAESIKKMPRHPTDAAN